MDWVDLAPRIGAGEFRDAVMQDHEAAKEAGVGGTPTYLIGGELLGGDISIDDLRAAIKSASAA
jgi:protein-disulfide isomerase